MSATIRTLLRPADFAVCPVWRYDEDLEGYIEVRSLDDLEQAASLSDLLVLAEFTTPGGERLGGHVVGVKDIYAIGLFANDEIVLINRNMHSRSREQVSKFLKLSGRVDRLGLGDMFPLHFESRWGGELFSDFSGVFTLS